MRTMILFFAGCLGMGLAPRTNAQTSGPTLKKSVFHQDDPNHYRKIEDFKVQHAVHTLAVDLETHHVYTPEQEADGKPVARMVVYEAVTAP